MVMAQNVTSHRMQKDMLCSSKSSCCTSIIPALRKAKAGQPVQALSGQFNNLVRPRLKSKNKNGLSIVHCEGPGVNLLLQKYKK